MTVGQRIIKLRKEKKISQKELANLINCSQPNISDYENDKISPSFAALEIIRKSYNINLDWLITGEGEMFLTSNAEILYANSWKTSKNEEISAFYNNPFAGGHKQVIEKQNDFQNTDFFDMPVVGDISAGEPIPVIQSEDLHYIPVSRQILDNPQNYFCFRVNGDSMHPEIYHNDYVVISKDYNYSDLHGRIIAARSDDGVTLKRIYIDNRNQVSFLFPVNQSYNPILLDERFTILGVIKILFRKYY
jgi:SOS-response transcriptional repressor LexA